MADICTLSDQIHDSAEEELSGIFGSYAIILELRDRYIYIRLSLFSLYN
ncbi:hypothetical protein [Wolbachia endosymbiont (group B) of Rhopobota naevana]|nr:hypothetical protein [Wolbachia endosymbiont (group B) of Rhopobota naevana]